MTLTQIPLRRTTSLIPPPPPPPPPPVVREEVTPPSGLWFTQILDHFNPTDLRVWKQKYFVNNTFYEDGGPIFLMIGGEATAEANQTAIGSWITFGKKYKALFVQLEHRFYGESHPTRDLSVKSLRYLSSEQALADLAYFITKFKEEKNLTANKVIAFGCSYAGSLAVWFRLKYPHLVHGSVSSSAPLLAQINFKEYLDVVTLSLARKGSDLCVQEIRKATKSINRLLKCRKGWRKIEHIFRLCSPLDGLNAKDVSSLFKGLSRHFKTGVQYNKVYGNFDVPIGLFCHVMTNKSYGNALHRYAEVNSVLSHLKCFNHTYDYMIEDFKKIEWTKELSIGKRQWTYQTCTEFGFFQTSDSSNQPFGSSFPLNFFLQMCKDIYGEKFDEDLLKRGVERTNIMYGGKNPKVTRVVFIHGSIDPWHRLGVLQDLNDEAPAIFINGTAHCANIHEADPSDPVQLREARQQIENIIGKWLQQD
ncbi:UNVERIFIED_CONTAM: hypothetical protein RMT77_001989 [Armadillidium vulgare]